MINNQEDITCFGLVDPSSVQSTYSLDMKTHKNVCMFANEQMNIMALNKLNAANSNVLTKYKDTSFHNATCDRQFMCLDQTFYNIIYV